MYYCLKISNIIRQLLLIVRCRISLLLVILFSFSGNNIIMSQTKIIDSLKIESSNSSTIEKSKMLLLIAKKFRGINYDSVVVYGTKALDNAEFIKDTNMIIESLIELAYINFSMGNNAMSMQLYDKAKQLCIKTNNYYYLADIYLDQDRYYNAFSNYAGVLSTLDTALSIIENNQIPNLKSNAYLQIANLYISIQDYALADNYAKIALRIAWEEDDKINYSNSLLVLGNLFLNQDNYDSTLFYYNKALAIAKEMNDNVLLQHAYRKITDYYIDLKDYNTSLRYIDSTIFYCNELHLNNELAALITYKAHISSQKNDFKNTLKYNLQALELRKSTGGKSSICASLLNIGSNYTELGDNIKAQDYLYRGLKLAKELNKVFYVAFAYEKLSDLYRSEGNYKEAMRFAELREKYQDSITTNKTNEKVMFFKNQYKLEREKTLSEKLKLEQKAKEATYLLITILLALSIILLLVWLIYFRNRSNKEIVKLSRIIETTTQAVILSNYDGKILYVNTGLVEMLGFENKSELVGRTVFDLTNKRGMNLIINEINPALASTGHWKGEMRNKRKDGSYIYTEETCSVIFDKKGNPEFYVAIFDDITQRKKAESELRTSRESLQKTVQLKDKMFSIISHDLTGPFSSILGLSELMINEYDRYQKEAHLRFCQLIYNSSKHTFELLTNLLHWSRSQLGSIELTPENIALYNIVSKSTESLILLINDKEIKFHNKVNKELNVNIDFNTFSIVIRNLISNAIKFTIRGGTIEILADKIDSNINLTISDTGVGISDEDLLILFDINDNKSRKGTEDEKGTGLGLVLCQEFTELNGGTITVESNLSQGSKFTISIPAG